MTQLIPTANFLQTEAHRQGRGSDWFVIEEKITRVDSEIGQAAAAGDVAKVRQLRTQRKNLEKYRDEQHRARIRPFVEAMEKRELLRPAPGERSRLAKERKKLAAQIQRKERAKRKLLDEIASDGAEGLLERAEEIDADLRLTRECLEGIDRRVSQIDEYCAEQEREKTRRASEARRRAEKVAWRRSEARLKKIASEFVDSLARELRNRQPLLDAAQEQGEKIAATASRRVVCRNARWNAVVRVEVSREIS